MVSFLRGIPINPTVEHVNIRNDYTFVEHRLGEHQGMLGIQNWTGHQPEERCHRLPESNFSRSRKLPQWDLTQGCMAGGTIRELLSLQLEGVLLPHDEQRGYL